MAVKRSKQTVGPYHNEIALEQKALFYKKRFYSDAENFTYFKDITPKIIPKINKMIEDNFPESKYPHNSYERYIAVLDFLNRSKKQKSFNSFDEMIVFLILAIDPTLSIYYHYLKVGYSAFATSEDRAQKERALMSHITSVVGSLDPQFLKYEEIYLIRFIKNEDIISYVNTDFSSRFFPLFKLASTFENVSDIEYKYISRRVVFFKERCEDPTNINTICYNLKNPNSVLEMLHPTHQVIFFILAADPELKALTIYEEESTVENIQARMTQELGFYHEDLIKVEKEFRKRFCPEKRVSTWTV